MRNTYFLLKCTVGSTIRLRAKYLTLAVLSCFLFYYIGMFGIRVFGMVRRRESVVSSTLMNYMWTLQSS
jgi:hypothetical protein